MRDWNEAFDDVMSDLSCINWSETDGSDVKLILKAAFTPCKNHKPEIIKKFEETSSLNKFQKSMITEILLKM